MRLTLWCKSSACNPDGFWELIHCPGHKSMSSEELSVRKILWDSVKCPLRMQPHIQMSIRCLNPTKDTYYIPLSSVLVGKQHTQAISSNLAFISSLQQSDWHFHTKKNSNSTFLCLCQSPWIVNNCVSRQFQLENNMLMHKCSHK